jgi:hypothetical protein
VAERGTIERTLSDTVGVSRFGGRLVAELSTSATANAAPADDHRGRRADLATD